MSYRIVFLLLCLNATSAHALIPGGYTIKTGTDLLTFAASIWNAASADQVRVELENVNDPALHDKPTYETKIADDLSMYASGLNSAILLGDAIALFQIGRSVGFRQMWKAEITPNNLGIFVALGLANVLPLSLNTASVGLLAKSAHQLPSDEESVDLLAQTELATLSASLPMMGNVASIASMIAYWRLSRENPQSAPLLGEP